MNKRSILFVVATAVVSSAACTTAAVDGDVPEVDDTELDPTWARPQEPYNGWTVSVGGGYSGNTLTGYVTFTKQSGSDATRGGGACVVGQNPVSPVSCSAPDDTICINYAQSLLGPSAWGYCIPWGSTTSSNPPLPKSGGSAYNGSCWIKPYSTTNCKLNPSQTPGTNLQPTLSTVGLPMTTYAVLGCMTKTAGPNPSCSQEPGYPSPYVRAFATLDWPGGGD